MRCCDRCKIEITSDIHAFHGGFLDYFKMDDIDLCKDCADKFAPLMAKFLSQPILEDKPVDVSEHRIADRNKKKKKKMSDSMQRLIKDKDTNLFGRGFHGSGVKVQDHQQTENNQNQDMNHQELQNNN